MKKILSVLLCVLLILTSAAALGAEADNETINVRINGRLFEFSGMVTDEGRTHIDMTDSNFGYLGVVRATPVIGPGAPLIIRNRKVYIMQTGCDYLTEVDISGVTDFDVFSADLLSGDPYAKSYVRKIPIDTRIIYGYIPLRAICEAIGADIQWNSEESCVDIYIDNTDVEWSRIEDIKEYLMDYVNLIRQVEAWKSSEPIT